MILLLRLMFILSDMLTLFGKGGWRGRVRMVVGFTSTCTISAYDHKLWVLQNSQNANLFPFQECLMKWNSSVHAVLNTLS
jgi:hypothetical protein